MIGSTLHQLPPLIELVGRETDLAELCAEIEGHESLGNEVSGAHIGLQGMGGVGKTALAITLAWRLKDRFPDAQLFIDFYGGDSQSQVRVTPIEAMRRIVRSFYPEAPLPDTLDELAPIYRSVLAERERRILLFFDGVSDADQIKSLLPPPNCLILFTSRTKFKLPGFDTRSIECLRPEKSVELLLKLAPRFEGNAAAVANLCGDLPLALQVVAGIVNEMTLYPVIEIVSRLRARKERLGPVDAAFDVSYELLSEELGKRWCLLSVFPASFDLPAATSVWHAHSASVDAIPAEVDSSAQDHVRADADEETLDAMQSLVNASLVEWNEKTRRFRLHELVRQFCDGKLSETDRSAALLRHTEHYQTIFAAIQKSYLKGGDDALRGLELFDSERAHLVNAVEWLLLRDDKESAALLIAMVNAVLHVGDLLLPQPTRTRWMEGQIRAAKLTGDLRAEGCALNNLGLGLISVGELSKAVEFLIRALAIARDTNDRTSEGRALGNLGVAYANLGETKKAIEFYEQHLLIARERLDRRVEGTIFGNLGAAYAVLGDVRNAMDFSRRALDVSREFGDHRAEANMLGNIGSGHFLLGDFQRAAEYQEWALSIRRKIGDLHGVIRGLGELASVHTAMGEPQVAIKYLDEALPAAQEISYRHGEATIFGNLGAAHYALGNVQNAVDHHARALAIWRDLGDRKGQGRSLGDLGTAYLSLGNPRQAVELFEDSLAIAREIGDRRGEGNAIGNLGSACGALGEPLRAIELLERQLIIVREIADRRGESVSLGNLGLAYANLGEFTKALNFHEQHLALAREASDPRGEGKALRNIGTVHRQLGNPDRAIECLEQALILAQKTGDRRLEANVMNQIGTGVSSKGDKLRAAEYYKRALAIGRETGDRKTEAAALLHLGTESAQSGEPEKARDLFAKSLEIAQGTDDRRGEGIALCNYAVALFQLGDKAQAIALSENALQILEEIGAPEVAAMRKQLSGWRLG